MPKKVLVVEKDRQLREFMRTSLEELDFVVMVAEDSGTGFRLARKDQPDLILVDFELPSMSGNEFCRKVRKDPSTDHQRMVMLAEENQLEDLVISPGGGADDFLIKPFSPQELSTKIQPFLSGGDEKKVISTGNGELDAKMGGGIPLGSLTLIEGDSGAGKSVLSQQMMHGSLNAGNTLSLFSSENSVRSLMKQMRSLSLDVTEFMLLSRLRVFPIETSQLGGTAPTILVKAIRRQTDQDMIFVDSLTSSITDATEQAVLAFFEDCKRMCGQGNTVVIIAHSHGLNGELLTRLRSLCDAHLQLRTEEMGKKLVKTLEVTKIRGADKATGNIISFEVEPGWGMRVVPMNKVQG